MYLIEKDIRRVKEQLTSCYAEMHPEMVCYLVFIESAQHVISLELLLCRTWRYL